MRYFCTCTFFFFFFFECQYAISSHDHAYLELLVFESQKKMSMENHDIVFR
jgi:hypothetical protein